MGYYGENITVLEQRCIIKFLYKNGIKCSEVLKLMNSVFEEQCLSKKQIYKWYKHFKGGREQIMDMYRRGRPITHNTQENIIKIRDKLLENPRVSIRALARSVGVSLGTCHAIMSDKLGLSQSTKPTKRKHISESEDDEEEAEEKEEQEEGDDNDDDDEDLYSVYTADNIQLENVDESEDMILVEIDEVVKDDKKK